MYDITYGWHFLSADGTAYRGYRPPAVGVWEPPIEDPRPCVRGYHGSPTILKALEYATGPILGRCEYRGVVWHLDRAKWAARERRCIARVDASAWLRFAACHFAEEALRAAGVTDKRSHNAISVARRFAMGQATHEELDAAWSAAKDAAWSAAKDAAWSAAKDAAWYAAKDAAWYAAWYAAWPAAKDDAKWGAAWHAKEAWLESAAPDLDRAPEWSHA